MDNNLPNGWIRKPLGEVVTHQKGKLPKSFADKKKEGYLPYIDIEAFEEGNIKRFAQVDKSTITTEKDVLVVWDGSRFGLSGLGKEGVLGSTLVRLYSDIVDTKYLFYFVLSKYRLINSRPRGTGTPHVEPDIFWPLDFWIAPENEQKRIVDRIEQLFSDLDEGEALLKTVQKQLATYRQSVLKAAVTGELTKDWREKNKKNLESGEKLLARILESRRKNWKGRGKYKELSEIDSSDFSDLPDGWAWATPAHLVDDEPNALCIGPFGSNLKVEDYTDSGVPLVFVRHIRAQIFDGLKPQYVSKKKAEELSAHKVIAGDILITKMGDPPGDVCIYPDGYPDAIITADCIRFSAQKRFLDTEYLELALKSRPVQTQILGITKGVAQQKITLENFRKVLIPLPGLEEQKQIASICDEKFSQISALESWCEAELKRSATLRQSILKSAFSGKLVAQDPADEPASELLARIKSADGAITKAKAKATTSRRGRKPRSEKTETAQIKHKQKKVRRA